MTIKSPYFLAKNDIMFPCPFGAAFFALDPADDDGVGVGAVFLAGAGASSSEKDSHPGS
jgi:hypothetical protein